MGFSSLQYRPIRLQPNWGILVERKRTWVDEHLITSAKRIFQPAAKDTSISDTTPPISTRLEGIVHRVKPDGGGQIAHHLERLTFASAAVVEVDRLCRGDIVAFDLEIDAAGVRHAINVSLTFRARSVLPDQILPELSQCIPPPMPPPYPPQSFLNTPHLMPTQFPPPYPPLGMPPYPQHGIPPPRPTVSSLPRRGPVR